MAVEQPDDPSISEDKPPTPGQAQAPSLPEPPTPPVPPSDPAFGVEPTTPIPPPQPTSPIVPPSAPPGPPWSGRPVPPSAPPPGFPSAAAPQYPQGPANAAQYPQGAANAAQYPQPTYGQPTYANNYPPAGAVTNGFAVAALVLGIVGVFTFWLYLIIPILAVVFGHIGYAKVSKSLGTQRGSGMALAGLILGYVMIAIGLFFLVFAIAAGL